MISIPDARAIVKPATDKWRDHRADTTTIARRMIAAGYDMRGYRMMACSTELQAQYCPQCGYYHISRANLCRDRLCPTCQWRLALRRYAEMVQVMAQLQRDSGLRYDMLTLTVRNMPVSELRGALRAMSRAWNDVTRRSAIKHNVAGWARSIEITYNAVRRDMHPHIHIILCSHGYLDLDTIRTLWQHAMRTDYAPVCDLRPISAATTAAGADYSAGVLEVFKYCTKSSDLLKMPLAIFGEYASAIKGVRLQTFGGCVKAARQQLGYADDDLPIEDGYNLAACPDCGAEMAEALLRWDGAGYALEALGGLHPIAAPARVLGGVCNAR